MRGRDDPAVRWYFDQGLLPVIKKILAREVTLGDVAAARADALKAQSRPLRLRHAVLRAVAARSSQPEEVAMMHKLARLSTGSAAGEGAPPRDQMVTNLSRSV